MAVGKIVCASFVKGACNAANKVGGMTSLNLPNYIMSKSVQSKEKLNIPIHRHVMVDAVQQEMQHEENWAIGQPIVNMKQEPVQTVLEYGPDYVAREEAQHSLDDCVHGNAGQSM